MKKRAFLMLAGLLCLLLLSGCGVKGHPLPEGMDEETVLEQGREIVALLNEGEYQQVYDRLRADGQESTSPEDIRDYMEGHLDKAGIYMSENEAMATGQTLSDTGEEYGTAVLYCGHLKKNVLYRIAFSTDMELMGIVVKVQ